MGVEFKDVAAAALAMAPILLHEWLGGQKRGNEWVGERRVNGGMGDSWAVNLGTGQWLHGAGDEKGGDLVSLYAALNHLDQLAALQQVAEQTGSINPNHVKTLPLVKPPLAPPEQIPDITPPIPPHIKWGAHAQLYYYGRAFVIARYEHLSGKQFCQFTWREGRWMAKSHPAPRPLYGAELLAKYPNAPVLLVEGEKCADTVRSMLRAYVGMTWASGASAVKKNDWSALKDREVILWPDADAPGSAAMAEVAQVLLPIAKRVRVIVPEGQSEGWDIADAVAAGWDAKTITGWATSHIKTVNLPADPEPPIAVALSRSETRFSRDVSDSATASDLSASAVVSWGALGLDTNQGGVPHATAANTAIIIQAHPMFKGRVWLDTFRQRIYHTVGGGSLAQPWTDADTLALSVMIQQQLKLPKFTSKIADEGVRHAAKMAGRNSLTDWLGSLRWDKIPRLNHWLTDCLGVEYNEYSQAVARNWPIGMVARAFIPGCKMDNMPVLEGLSGLSKTSFLEVLGDPWYKSLPMAFGDKDFLQAIQGTWLVEIPDMTGFSRREHTSILATITVRTDSYRASYGRYTEDHPRVAVFAATSETDDYLQDRRGRRRYWPLRCSEISLDTLRQTREQIFAEAVHEYRRGSRWWEMPDQANEEQLMRAEPDLWNDKVMEYIDNMSSQGFKVSSAQILYQALDVPYGKQDDQHKKRIARIMRENQCIQTRTSTQRLWSKKI